MSALRRLAGAEILRACSGSSFPLLLMYAVMAPAFGFGLSGSLDSLGALDDVAATRSVFAFVACAALGACFYGAYAYTRETYYHSLERTLLLGGREDILLAKAVAGAISGAIFGVVGLVCWSGITLVLLATAGRTFAADASLLGTAIGTVLSCALCGMIGVAIGYAVRNYYLGIPLILVLPALAAAPMLTDARPVERFLPIGAVAGATVAPLDGLLPEPLALLVLLGWAVVALALAGLLENRRGR
ncbi:hypothetical protein HQQ80_05445 [Microbacteriaceae bacterium VKM Ac-2855]|nr:hypothetical protein [Microbacteriaceae bacterium VKM Ac-2855]